MKNFHRDIYENEISILEEEFLSLNDNNNNLSFLNEYENKSVSTINSIATPYTESVLSEQNSENTWSSSRVDKLQLCTLGQTSSGTMSTSTSRKSIDPETVASERNSVNTLSSSGLQNMQFSSTASSETIPGRSIDPEGWKAISEYEDFWKAWENGQDIEKINTSINKIQDVFEKVHLPEPPLPTKQIGIENKLEIALPVSNNNNVKARLPEPTPARPSLTNVPPGILDYQNDQLQDDTFDDEVSPDSTVQELDEDVLTEDSYNSYIDDTEDVHDIPDEWCDYDEN